MCTERRATISRTQMEQDGNVTTYWSFVLKQTHIVISILAGIGAILLFGCTVVEGTKSVMAKIAQEEFADHVVEAAKEVADQEFDARLELFHTEAIPAIDSRIETKLDTKFHELSVQLQDVQSSVSRDAIASHETRISVIESRLGSIESTVNRTDANVLELLKRGK